MSAVAYETGDVTVLHGDCIAVMATLPDASFDAIVCDPPYGLEFMGKAWDSFRVGDPGTARHRGERAAPPTSLAFGEFTRQWALEALRVVKPGGHLAAFGGTRMFHRLAAGIEDAGWELRDCLSWLYSSGFPKSHDVSKAIDKQAGHWRGRAGAKRGVSSSLSGPMYERTDKGEPVTEAASQAAGWGTALKPAWEPIVLARRPMVSTVSSTFVEHGTGALHIDAARIPATDHQPRWPANVVIDEAAADRIDSQTVDRATRAALAAVDDPGALEGYVGGASRFFFCAKAGRDEKPWQDGSHGNRYVCTGCGHGQYHYRADGCPRCGEPLPDDRGSNELHPTVKPLALMRWLVRLVTPRGGVVLDPFAGTGTTGEAARLEGFKATLIEAHEPYLHLIRQRLDKPWQPNLTQGAS